jgi:ribosomal protein L35
MLRRAAFSAWPSRLRATTTACRGITSALHAAAGPPPALLARTALATSAAARSPIAAAAATTWGRTLHICAAAPPASASPVGLLPTGTALRATSAISALFGARRWRKAASRAGRAQSRHKMGAARAQPRRVVVKLRRDPFKHRKFKLKSHQGALKRFYQKGDGTFMHKSAGKSHLMAGSSRRRQTYRLLAHRPVTAKGIIKKLKRLMPYGTTMQPPRKYVQPRMWERPEGWTEAVAASKLAPHTLGTTAADGSGKKKKKASAA